MEHATTFSTDLCLMLIDAVNAEGEIQPSTCSLEAKT